MVHNGALSKYISRSIYPQFLAIVWFEKSPPYQIVEIIHVSVTVTGVIVVPGDPQLARDPRSRRHKSATKDQLKFVVN